MKQKKIKNTETTTPRKNQFRSKKKNLQVALPTEEQTDTQLAIHTDSPAPSYQAPDLDNKEPIKALSFSKLIANEDILSALEKTSYQVPSELLFAVMPATLRGSDALILKSKHSDGFLIGVVPAISKILYSENQEDKHTKPVALFLFPTENLAKSAYQLTLDVFENFKITFTCLTKDSSELGQIVFTTPKTLLNFIKNEDFKISHFKLLTVHELHAFEGDDKDALNTVLDSIADSHMQKILISYQNTPQVREMAFKYLEDPEIFSFLSNAISDQYPRQFAHALEATKKFQVLLGYLKTYKPRAALVVANTRTVAEWIAFKLHGNNIKVSLLTSPLSPYANRLKFLDSIVKGEMNVFVATDDAVKNFGIEGLHCIYHFDLPENPRLFIDRLNKLIGARNPISIAFVCEDYGFNMGKIEDTLGFKIRVTIPDKNFFNFKDTSEYPLETSGRVKAIGQQVPESSQAQSASQENTEKSEQMLTGKTEQAKTEQTITSKPEQVKTEQKFDKHIDKHPGKAASQDENRTNARQQKHTPRTAYQPDTSKFVRRDERAREAVADAVLAARMAEEKRQAKQNTHEHRREQTSASSSDNKQASAVSTLLGVFSDALRAGFDATKASLLHSTEHKFPAIHRFLKRRDKK